MAEGQGDTNEQGSISMAVKRRGLIAGAAALVASAALLRKPESVAATDINNTVVYRAIEPFGGSYVMVLDASNLPPVNSLSQPYNVTGMYSAGKGNGTGIVGLGGDSGDGVAGQAYRGPSKGVSGTHFGGGYGVYGESVNGRGVYGIAPAGFGVQGVSTSLFGVVGQITGGSAPGTLAITGTNNATAPDSHGIVGVSTVGHGLVGTTNYTPPAGGGAPYYAGLVGNAPNGAYAGLFFGNVQVAGTLNGHTAIMQHAQIAVAHPDGTHRLSYALSSTENWIEDAGKGSLTNGQAIVKVDPAFAGVAEMGDYHVFLTAHGNYHLHVAEMRPDGFVVRVTDAGGEVAPGSQVAKVGGGAGTFSWRVMAKRKDAKAERLATYVVPNITPPDLSHLPKPAPADLPKKP